MNRNGKRTFQNRLEFIGPRITRLLKKHRKDDCAAQTTAEGPLYLAVSVVCHDLACLLPRISNPRTRPRLNPTDYMRTAASEAINTQWIQ
jgi:hypothetical protein